MDVLSDVCRALRLSGGIYFRASFSGDWAVEVPASRREIRFHLGLEGSCRVTVGQRDCRLASGDLVLVPHGATQILSSSRGSAQPVPLAEALETGLHEDELRMLTGGADPSARLLCGSCTVDDSGGHPLLAALPALILLRQGDSAGAPWIADALRVLTLEAQQRGAGMEAIATRLIEVLFIQAIRELASRADQPRGSFLAALGDAHIARALAAIHRDPARAWTVSSLAREAGLSRSRFAQSFAATTGRTPIGYLRQWRLLSARRLLRESRLTIDAIAERVGYRSVPSFTRRFGAAFGLAPAAMRLRFRERSGSG